MNSEAGNIYAFDESVKHWKQLVLPDFLNQSVRARNLERENQNFLIHGSKGRLFLASKQNKSVPQKMNLE